MLLSEADAVAFDHCIDLTFLKDWEVERRMGLCERLALKASRTVPKAL